MIAEKPVKFGRSDSLVGVWCAPMERQIGAPAVVFINAGIIHRVGPNRLHVNLARTLAGRGVPSLRFDLSGLGDSLAPRDERGSILDWVRRDVDDAIELAATLHPGDGIVVMGLCSGADNAFHAATRDPRVVGAVLLDPNAHRTPRFYVHRYLRAARSWKTWRSVLTGAPIVRRVARLFGARAGAGASPFLAPTTLMPKEQMRTELDRLIERGARLLYIFTGGLSFRYNYGSQFRDAFPGLIDGESVGVEYFGSWDHTFSDPDAQATLIALIETWMRRNWKVRESLPAA